MKNEMEKYIMTFEDGQHYLADKITKEDENLVGEGTLSVIRCSDQKELLPTGEWRELPRWGAEFKTMSVKNGRARNPLPLS